MIRLLRIALGLAHCTALAGCGIPFFEPVEALAVASIATVPIFGRSLPDIIYSGISGKDCSVVRLEQGRSYCRPTDPPIEVARVCTRSLGTVDCWINPETLVSPARGLADSQAPTSEQEAWRTRRWPNF
jgi:hypothetical protein